MLTEERKRWWPALLPCLLVFLLATLVQLNKASDIELHLPEELLQNQDGMFRLDYKPTRGFPAPNFTFQSFEASEGIIISDALPGSDYTFQLYFTNTSRKDWLAWSGAVVTEPDPPSNLSISIHNGKKAEVFWAPPLSGGITGYRLVVQPLPLGSAGDNGPRSMHLKLGSSPFVLSDLMPGASYEVNLYSVFHEVESSVFISSNFTTKPNTPGRFIVWFRNETTLLVLWQPPYPSGIFDQYKVSIMPHDAVKSVLFVDKEGEPPGPAQAAFYGLVPGRAYNISVQTVSQNQISAPTDAQYRTVPLPPSNVTFDKNTVTPYSFDIRWEPPKALSEFDRYQITLTVEQHTIRQTIGQDEKRLANFDVDLQPGHTYEVVVKTVSANVASWPVTGNVTTRPLPIYNLTATAPVAGEIWIEWQVDNRSVQDSYMVKYNELDVFNTDANAQVVTDTKFHLSNLLLGRNYSVSVLAVSKGIPSEPTVIFQATRPASPVIELVEPTEKGWNISWKSDVTSRQDSFAVIYIRNKTQEKFERTTKNNWLLLDNLYPGADYEIKVYAISYDLWSEPHSYFQTVAPKPPENLQIVKASNSTMILTWNAPEGSLVDHYLVRHKPYGSAVWRETGVVNTTSYEIKDLVAGERYTVQLASVSGKAESQEVREVEQIMYPNAIKHVRHILDSLNITFEWQVPPGRVDYYIIVYNPVRDPIDQHSKQVTDNSTLPGNSVSVIIDGLKPGELYSFRFYAVSHDLRSEGVGIQTRTMPVIDSVVNIVTDEQETKTLGIKYTPTPTRSVVFDRYRIQLSDFSIPAQEKLFNDTNRLVLFDNLVPGRLYNISIWTVSGGVYSVPIYRQARLFPEPIKEITPLSVTDTDITLNWVSPFGDKDGYEVQYQDHHSNLVQNFTFTERISYKDLRPHHNYTFLIIVISGYDTSTIQRSLPISKTIQTLESVPGKVNYFTSYDVKPNEISLQWSLPQTEQNGILTGYKITYYMKGSQVQRYQLFDPTEKQGVIRSLVPGKTYIFEIQAHTKVGPGGKAQLEESTPIWAPPTPADNLFPTEVSRTSHTIKVRFRKNYFSNSHGSVTSYTVVVAEEGGKESNSNNPLPSWKDVQVYSVWPPYQAVDPYYPFNGTLVEDLSIGSDDCKSTKGYCNGPLKAGTVYRVKIRAFTVGDKYSDTVYSFPIQTDPDNTALIAGIIVPLSLLLVVALILVVLRKRRVGPFTKKSGGAHSKDDTMSIPESEIITTRPIKLKDFAEHYRIMSADSDFRFSEEFELLKHVGRDKPCSAADIPPNRPKNRFTNILPYDHSRVKLMPTDDEEGSDYINANYIPGFNSPREFIVTQGPLHSTRDDFWRMSWEQNCRAIVMLTRCVEKGREKCDHYWPFDTQPVYYGDIQVTILNESQYPDWTVSEFKVCRGEQSRIMRHFHFTTWPDFGVPDPPQTLVRFVRAFRDRVSSQDSKPVVVHCSAGVGRSGTFIALDRILQQIQKYDSVDIFGHVYEMRKERVWMVQNEQQYICIHQCLLVVLEGREDMIDLQRAEAHDNQGFEDDEGIAESGI